MTYQEDNFTKGMASWDENDDQNLANYTRWQYSLIRPFLGKKILEIGAGSGRMTAVILKDFPFERYTAVEPSGHFMPVLKKRFEDLEILQTTIQEMSAAFNDSFDTIVMIHLLEHIEDDKSFIAELRRFLTPKGRIIILVPALGFLMSQMDRNIGHYRRYNKSMMKELITGSDLKIIANVYDNFIGVIGWFLFCTLRKYNYQSQAKKPKLMSLFRFFDTYVLPLFSKLERFIHPPAGLNLLTVLEKSE